MNFIILNCSYWKTIATREACFCPKLNVVRDQVQLYENIIGLFDPNLILGKLKIHYIQIDLCSLKYLQTKKLSIFKFVYLYI